MSLRRSEATEAIPPLAGLPRSPAAAGSLAMTNQGYDTVSSGRGAG